MLTIRRSFLIIFVVLIVLGSWLFWSGPWASLAQTAVLPTLRPTAYIDESIIPTPKSADLATATPSPTATPTQTATPLPTATPTATPTPTGPYSPTLSLTPGDPQPYLETYRLVAFYGNPLSAQLGVLASAPRATMLTQLRATAALYQAYSSEHAILPTYHIITTVADPYAGQDGSYSHWLSTAIIDEWVAAAKEAGVAVILDIQPGYANIAAEVERIKPYLYEPHVHLALDPEFIMWNGRVPGQGIGHINGYQINPVQATLNEIALEIGVNKVLIIHQFDPTMVYGKTDIVDYPHVELVFDADGFGGPRAKTGDYLQYANEPGFEYGGFKLFYSWDSPLMGPADVMSLDPAPAIIIYQ